MAPKSGRCCSHSLLHVHPFTLFAVLAYQRVCADQPQLPSTNRKFVKGDAGMKKAVATRIAGSADLYQTNNRCQLTAHAAAATAAAYLMLEGASLPLSASHLLSARTA